MGTQNAVNPAHNQDDDHSMTMQQQGNDPADCPPTSSLNALQTYTVTRR